MINEETQQPHNNVQKNRLYNIIILRGFFDFIQNRYPHVEIDMILSYINITQYQLNDPGFWFTQEQSDRFYEIATKLTGNKELAKEAGEYSVLSGSYSIMFEYIAGFFNIQTMLQSAELISRKWSHGAKVTTRKIGKNSAELVSVPLEGVEEKQYQCENRLGVINGLGLALTNRLFQIDHPECVHRGDSCCRYRISWQESSSLLLRRARNWISILGLVLVCSLYPFISLPYTLITLTTLLLAIMAISWSAEHLENTGHLRNITSNSKTAEMLMEEIDSRYSDSMLVQEIGQTGTHIFDIDELLTTSLQILKKRLDFDRGAIALVNSIGTHLVYQAGYGYEKRIERLIKKTILPINIESNTPLVSAAIKQTTLLINDINEILPTLHPRYQDFLKRLGVRAFLCVPIIFESKTLGLLIMERNASPKPIKQSELNFLFGIAHQIGISINNARSFQRLQESEERYRELVENANSIILRINTKGNITFFNEFAQKFFGYLEEEVLGQDILQAMPMLDDMISQSIGPWLRGIRKDPEKFMNTQTAVLLKDGRQVWIAWTNKPIWNDNGNLCEVLCIGNDISDLKRVEEEKLKLEQDLLRAQKMEALGTLAGGVAHDLNNILSSVVSYPDLMLMKLPEDSPLVRPLKNIRMAGEKAAAIVQDLLTMARSGVSITKVVNLNDVLHSYLTSTEFEVLASHHPNVIIKTDLEALLMNSLGSEIHLGKTIMNLVTNAAEAMPKGGAITISTQNVYVDRPIRGYDQVVEGEYILLSVSDTGIGINTADIPHIFEPFYTKKVMGRSGTGLGMSVVWGTVKDHNGYIDIHSEVGVGTTIFIYLPVTRRPVAEEKQAIAWEDMRGSEKILVVDDIPEQREIAFELLSELGYSVETVSSGEEALNYLLVNDANILLLDMVMEPGMDGLETYQRILDFKPEQKAIIVSGFSETEKVKKALRMGASAYLKKPYALDKIGRVIRAELDRPAA